MAGPITASRVGMSTVVRGVEDRVVEWGAEDALTLRLRRPPRSRRVSLAAAAFQLGLEAVRILRGRTVRADTAEIALGDVPVGVRRSRRVAVATAPFIMTTPDVALSRFPLSLGPAVWYDPYDLSTVFQDHTATIPVTTDGESIGCVLDKSGNGRHWTQSSSSLKPKWRTAGGVCWIELDGVDDLLGTTASLTLVPPLTIYGAVRRGALVSTGSLYVLTVDQSLTNYFGVGTRPDNSLARAAARGASATPSLVPVAVASGVAGTFAADTPVVLSAVLTTATVNVVVNGVQVGTLASGWGANVGGASAFRSSGQASGAVPFAVRYYGVALFTRELSAGEASQLTTWLGAKAGISI